MNKRWGYVIEAQKIKCINIKDGIDWRRCIFSLTYVAVCRIWSLSHNTFSHNAVNFFGVCRPTPILCNPILPIQWLSKFVFHILLAFPLGSGQLLVFLEWPHFCNSWTKISSFSRQYFVNDDDSVAQQVKFCGSCHAYLFCWKTLSEMIEYHYYSQPFLYIDCCPQEQSKRYTFSTCRTSAKGFSASLSHIL